MKSKKKLMPKKASKCSMEEPPCSEDCTQVRETTRWNGTEVRAHCKTRRPSKQKPKGRCANKEPPCPDGCNAVDAKVRTDGKSVKAHCKAPRKKTSLKKVSKCANKIPPCPDECNEMGETVRSDGVKVKAHCKLPKGMKEQDDSKDEIFFKMSDYLTDVFPENYFENVEALQNLRFNQVFKNKKDAKYVVNHPDRWDEFFEEMEDQYRDD